MSRCDCLTAEAAQLPHAAGCASGDGTDASNLQALAELAAYRDIDAALYAYRTLSTTTGEKRA
jgi:hypothetical protein